MVKCATLAAACALAVAAPGTDAFWWNWSNAKYSNWAPSTWWYKGTTATTKTSSTACTSGWIWWQWGCTKQPNCGAGYDWRDWRWGCQKLPLCKTTQTWGGWDRGCITKPAPAPAPAVAYVASGDDVVDDESETVDVAAEDDTFGN